MAQLNRRDALVAAGLLSAGVATGAEAARGSGVLKQSICAWCFTSRGQKWTLDKVCEVAKQLSVPSVELIGPKDFPLLKQHGLTCGITSTGMGFTHGFNNLGHQEELVYKTKDAITKTAEAKFPSVIGFVGMQWLKPNDPKSAAITRDDAFKNCVAGMKLVASHAEKANVTLCIEHLNSRDGSEAMTGHPGYQGDDLDFVMSILKAVSSPRVKLLFDIYHVQIMHGDLIRRLDECKDYLGHIHTAGNPGRHELDDTQEINYPAVMKKLAALKYTGYIGHEFIPTRDPLDGLKQAVATCTV